MARWKCTYCRDCVCIVEVDIGIKPILCPFMDGYTTEWVKEYKPEVEHE